MSTAQGDKRQAVVDQRDRENDQREAQTQGIGEPFLRPALGQTLVRGLVRHRARTTAIIRYVTHLKHVKEPPVDKEVMPSGALDYYDAHRWQSETTIERVAMHEQRTSAEVTQVRHRIR